MTVSLAVPDILVARAQAGDEEALEALYRAFETPVYNLARRMLKRPEDAEDVLQETFLEVVRSITQYRGEGFSRTGCLTVDEGRYRQTNRIAPFLRPNKTLPPIQEGPLFLEE